MLTSSLKLPSLNFMHYIGTRYRYYNDAQGLYIVPTQWYIALHVIYYSYIFIIFSMHLRINFCLFVSQENCNHSNTVCF